MECRQVHNRTLLEIEGWGRKGAGFMAWIETHFCQQSLASRYWWKFPYARLYPVYMGVTSSWYPLFFQQSTVKKYFTCVSQLSQTLIFGLHGKARSNFFLLGRRQPMSRHHGPGLQMPPGLQLHRSFLWLLHKTARMCGGRGAG